MARKKIPLLERYARQLESKKQAARDLINSIEASREVYVPESFKKAAFSDTPKRVTKKTLQEISKVKLNPRYIKNAITMETNELIYPFPLPNNSQKLFTPSQPVTLSVHGTEAQMTKQLNRKLKNVYPTSALSRDLDTLLQNYKEGEDYVIHDVPDKTRTVDWVKGVEFKTPLSYQDIKSLMSIANMDKMTASEFEENAEHRRYISNINNARKNATKTAYDPSPLSNLSQQTIDKLENLMNSSAAWKKAGAGRGLDSDQVQENWTKMFKALSEADNNNDDETFDLLTNAIEHNATWINYTTTDVNDEGEEVTTKHHESVYKFVENIIGEAMTPVSKMKKKVRKRTRRK